MAGLPTCQDQLQSPKGRLVAAHSARNSLQSVQQVSIHHRYLQGPRRGPVSAWLAACFFCHAGCITQDEAQHGSHTWGDQSTAMVRGVTTQPACSTGMLMRPCSAALCYHCWRAMFSGSSDVQGACWLAPA